MQELLSLGMVLWTVMFGLLFMMNTSLALGYARWSLGLVRRMLAWPFLAIGGLIRGGKKKKKSR